MSQTTKQLGYSNLVAWIRGFRFSKGYQGTEQAFASLGKNSWLGVSVNIQESG